ncbi:beta strand repeat-containing protein [Hydrogenophaga sp.]|uniref:beta strand repeat-containing protein n=1 Tax=Hydrogenophaga sp. TaxID=1904254 RepID=UPI0035B13794
MAGALGLNVVASNTQALLEGDTNSSGQGAQVNAGAGNVDIVAGSQSESLVKAGADVKGSGDDAKVGVGVSAGVHVGVNTTVAEVGDKAVLRGGADMAVNATASHKVTNTVEGGAAGAQVSITPVIAATISVNTTQARVGTQAAGPNTGLSLSGEYSSSASQTNSLTTSAKGSAQGDVAVGAALAGAIAVDDVGASLQRDVDSSAGVSLASASDTSIKTEAIASAKGAKQAKKNATTGAEEPEAGTTVDEQKKNQLDFAKGRNSSASSVNTDTPEAKTPDTSNKTPGTDAPAGEPSKEQSGKKVSVAAAIGVGVARNQSQAEVGEGLTINAGTGALSVHAESGTNYNTKSSGEAVSDDVGVGVAVSITATSNLTSAAIGSGTEVTHAGDVTVSAESRQNRATDYLSAMSAEAVAGASGGDVAVAGSLALVLNDNTTRASVDEGVRLGSAANPVGHVKVTADDTSKISAQARAGALSKGDESKVGVGASFAALLSNNVNEAIIGRDADDSHSSDATNVDAVSIEVAATKHRVSPLSLKNFDLDDIKNLDFDTVDPSTYLGSNNYYTEAIAGAAAKGDVAVSGAFAVNLFKNSNNAAIGDKVTAHTTGVSGTDNHGVEVASQTDTKVISFTGGVAGAKQVGVGISNTNVVSLDTTTASIGKDSDVKADGATAGVEVSADAKLDMANIGVSAGVSTEGTGVGGVLGVFFALGKTEAKIDDNTQVRATGDVAVTAHTDSLGVIVAGAVGGGDQVGVGASVSGNVQAMTTSARIGEGADVSASKTTTVAATAEESSIAAVVAGAGGGEAGVAGALSVNVMVSKTEATIGQDAKINTDAAYAAAGQSVAVRAADDTTVVSITGAGAGSGGTGVGAALDTTVLAKKVKAAVDDDTDADADKATVKATKDVVIEAASSDDLVSVTVGFAGGSTTGVGGAVSVGVVKDDVQARIGSGAVVDADANVGVHAQDDITAVMTAGGAAGGGTAGVGGSLAVATLLGTTKATIGDGAAVNARGLGAARDVYSGETVFSDTAHAPASLAAKRTESAKGLAVTAFNREKLVTTIASGAGGGTAGVAATVSANVIANTTEASIGRNALINQNNTTAGADQQVRVNAVDETLLINTAAGAGGGGTAGVGAAANVGVIVKNTTASIGRGTEVNAKKALDLTAASADLSVSTTAGFAGGGSAGVGGAVGGVGVANTTRAFIEDGTSSADAAKVAISGGDLAVKAEEFASSWMVSGAGAGGGAAGVGASVSVAVNTSKTEARIGDYAQTDATGTTSVQADSTENVNTITVAGSGGGTAGVSGSVAVNVVASRTEAAIGEHAKVNQTLSGAQQDVDVAATDRIISVAVAGAAAGGGAAGVGGTAAVTVAQNKTIAAIEDSAQVKAGRDVSVEATGDKYANSVTVAGSGGGAAGVSGAVSILAVGMVLDSEGKKGLNGGQTQSDTDAQTNKSAVGDMLGSSTQSRQTKTELDNRSSKLAVSSYLSDSAPVPDQNTQATIASNTKVEAGQDVTVKAEDKTTVVAVSGTAAGGGAAGVGGSAGVVLLRDSAAATIGDGATVDAGRTIDVGANTKEAVYNVGVSAAGGGAAAVTGAVAVNVVSSETVAAIGNADINKSNAAGARSVKVQSGSDTDLVTVAGSGGGAGAAAVGGVLTVNTLSKKTSAHIAEGADVEADNDVRVSADSAQKIIGAAISVQGAGAAAVAGSAIVNVVDNRTEAFIGSATTDTTKLAAQVDSSGNVVIAAADDTLLAGVAASGTGAGAAAVGGTASVNVVSSQTSAYLGDGSSVNARGNAPGATVYDGTVDNANTRAMPALPAGQSGAVDVDHDGTSDGSVGGGSGASFNVRASGEDSSGNANGTASATSTKDSSGNAIGNAGGGLGTRGTGAVKGFSVVAVGSEKVVTASLGVAGAGAAGVTLGATANVITSTTKARIGDSTQVNQTGAAGAAPSVNVKATDDTFMVMASGTVAGAAFAGVGGTSNTAVISKQTSATIGDADVKASSVTVDAKASEQVFVASASAGMGFAGVGAAVGVASVSNTTRAGIDTGATVDASGDLRVKAGQDTAVDIYTLAGSGGVVGVSGAVSVAVVDNTTQAYVGGAAAGPVTTIDADGTTEVAASSEEDVSSVTISAAAGGVGVAGSVGVKVLTSETTASIGDNTRVNQTPGTTSVDVKVSATDTARLKGGGGSGAVGGVFGAGAISDTNIIRNTTTASIGKASRVKAAQDVQVAASSTKQVDSTAIALAASTGGGVAGAVSVAVVGASLDADSQSGLGDGKTATKADTQMQRNDAGGQLGSSEHVQGTKTTLSSRASGLSVASDMNDASTSSKDKTQATIGDDAVVTAGRHIDVTATDRTELDLTAQGLSGGFVGIGGAVGVGLTRSTTEAKVGERASLKANSDGVGTGNATVSAQARNVSAGGSNVTSRAGTGGVVGVSAAVSVLKDSSVTKAQVGDSAKLEQGTLVTVSALTDRKSEADTFGTAAGGLAIGASVARAEFDGETEASLGASVAVGTTLPGTQVGGLSVSASDVSVATASAVAGAAGILSGSGADAKATVDSSVKAFVDDGTQVKTSGTTTVSATGTAQTRAEAKGVNIGGGSVGASLATARSNADIEARVGAGSSLQASTIDISANRLIGSAPTAVASALGASGGVLFGINATEAQARSTGTTRATVEENTTFSGATTVEAESHTTQVASGVGISVGGFLAVGADIARATSDTTTEATLGDDAKVTGTSLAVRAEGNDTNYAHGIAGSGGLVSAPFSLVETGTTSHTTASTGGGDNAVGDPRKIDVGSLTVEAGQHNQFDAWIDSTNASLVGVSGAKAVNNSNATTLARLGPNGYIEADSIRLAAHNEIDKVAPGPATSNIPGLTSKVPTWNVDSSSGGLADVPAAGSTTTIVNNATAQIGSGTHLVQTNTVSPGSFTVDAWNDVTATDRVKMASGGAVSAASGESSIKADTNNATVSIGDSAVISGAGDIGMGARSVANISTQTSVDVWGLVGVAPAGDSTSRFKATNTVDVGQASITALHDIGLYAGANSSGVGNNITTVARTDVFNNTAIPVNRDPVADAIIETNSQINVASGADVSAVRDITLFADEGTTSAQGVGVGKDIYREALADVASAISEAFGGDEVSFETRTGRSQRTLNSNVKVDGDVHVGIKRNQSVTLNATQNGSTWNPDTTWTDGVEAPTTEFGVGIAADINKRIANLRTLANAYAGTAAGPAYLAEIAFLEQKLVDLGLATRDAAGHIVMGSGGGNGISPRAAAISLRDSLQAQYNRVQNVLLPPVITDWNTKNTALGTANTNLGYYQDRLTALNTWKTEAAKATPSTTVIDAAKNAVYTAENSIASAGATVAGYTRQCNTVATCVAAPDTTAATNQRNTYDTTVQDPAQTAFNTVDSQRTTLETQATNLNTSVSDLNARIPTMDNVAVNGPTANFVTIPNITAQLGSIHVKGDSLTGSGKLRAPGDAKVDITNNTPAFLVVKDITIDAESARINFNGVDVNNVTDINRVNAPGAVAAFSEVVTGVSNPSLPEVVIHSNFDPDAAANPSWLKGPAPDIRLTGNISNPRGLVEVHSKAGSILSQGNVLAGTVDIKADNGDFVQSYTDNFFHVGGDPRTIYETKDAVPPVAKVEPGGILSNGSVFISSRYLNINGTVQSGIANYDLVLPSGGALITGSAFLLGVDQANVTAYRNSYLANPAGVSETTSFVNDAGIAVAYNARKNRLEMTEAQARTYAGTSAGQTHNASGIYALVDDYGNVAANYDAQNDRYVLDGTTVKGGYIQLYGQIMNTASPSAGTGTGGLKVLDGYGQINITNPTGKDIVLGKLDTGRGAAGVIDITDIQYIDGANAPHSIISRITRENGSIRVDQKGRWTLNASGLPLSFDDNWTSSSTSKSVIGATGLSGVASTRTATYNPQPGLAFTYAIGTDESTVSYYSYSGHTFFGLFNITENLDKFDKVGPVVLSAQELPDGRVLTRNRSLSNPYYTTQVESVTAGTTVRTVTEDYSTCDPWLCITQTFHYAFNDQTPTKVVTNKFLRGDNPINISFIGADTGTINVNSAGNVVLTGALNNKAGGTTVVAGNSGTGVLLAGKNIVQGSDSALITTKDLSLTASGSVGGFEADNSTPKAVRINATGTVNASAADGNVVLKQTFGALKAGQISAAGSAPGGKGRVVLQSDGNIEAAPGLSQIRGNSLNLSSQSGSIGSVATPLQIQVGYDGSALQRGFYGVTASAQGDIGLQALTWSGNTQGNLLVNTAVSSGGDVKLVAPGSMIDNNPNSTTDTRSQTELANLWDELKLRGAASVEKADEAVAAYGRGKDNNYRLYWLLRQGQADGGAAYDPTYAYHVSAGERSALTASGMSAAQITQFEADRTSQYHALHAEVGSLTTGYNAAYHYTVSTDESDRIRSGATWSDQQLALSVGAGLLKNVTDTVTTIKSPNVKGRNIVLQAGQAIGSYDSDVTIDLSELPTLSTEKKAVLAAAERGDASISGTTITIKTPRPFNVETGTGALTATASAGDAFIGSEADLRINNVNVAGNARIKTAASLVNAAAVAGATNVNAQNLILEAANGGIGARPGDAAAPLRISLAPGKSLVARASDNIWIDAPGNLVVDTVFSRADTKLEAGGSILDVGDADPLNPDVNVRSKNLVLTARSGSVGTAADSLDVGVNADGQVVATASTAGQGVYLNAPSGEHFNVGAVTSGGDARLSAANDLAVQGTVSAPGTINLSAGGAMTLEKTADVHNTVGGVVVAADTLTVEDDGAQAARLRSDTGTIDITTRGDAKVTGIETGSGTASAVRIRSTAGRVLDSGDTRLDVIADAAPGAKLDVSGKLGVGSDGNPLDVRVRNLAASSSDGSVALNVSGNVNVTAVQAGDAVNLTASGNVTGASVSSTGLGTQGTDKSVLVKSTAGSVTLDTVAGTQTVTVEGLTGVDIAHAGSTGGSIVFHSASGDVVSGTALARQDVTMTADTGAVTADSTTATDGDVVFTAAGAVDAQTTVAGGDVRATSSTRGVNLQRVTAQNTVNADGRTGVTIGRGESLAGDVQLHTAAGDIATGTVIAARNVTMTADTGAITADSTTATGGNVVFTADGAVDAQTTVAGGDVRATSRTRGVNLQRVTAQNTVNADGQTGVTIGRGESLAGDVQLHTAAGDIATGVVIAARNVTMTADTGAVTADSTTATGGDVVFTAAGAVDAQTTVAGGAVRATSSGGAARLNAVTAQGDVAVNAQTSIDTGTVSSTAGSVAFSAATGKITAGTTAAGLDVRMDAAANGIAADVTRAGRDVALSAAGQIAANQIEAGGKVGVVSSGAGVQVTRARAGRDVSLVALNNVTAGNLSAGGDTVLRSRAGSVNLGQSGSGGSLVVDANDDISVDEAGAGQDILLNAANGGIDAGSLNASGAIELNAAGDVGVGSAGAQRFAANSRGGSVDAGSVGADVATMSAPGAVRVASLQVGSSFDLQGSQVKASIRSTGAGDVRGAVTGLNGGVANDVQLTLDTPNAFRFSNLYASTGNVSVLNGDLYVDALWVLNRMTLSNPWTTVLVDQNDRSIQPFDVQLYSAGLPFSFGLSRNRVTTGAFVISRSPAHEVFGPGGNNRSAAEQADFELAILNSIPSPFFAPLPGTGTGPGFSGLVTFTGFPVRSGDDECPDGSSGNSANSDCKKENQ